MAIGKPIAMKLTVLVTGDVPLQLQDRFAPYPEMFRRMFDAVGHAFDYEIVRALDGAPLPDPATLEGVVIPGSPAGVYDDLPWIEPLRGFIRRAYAAGTPMVGVCFGHQVIADALGGDVRKSEKGWGIGRHTYAVRARPAAIGPTPDALSVACSHQDQVIGAPADAEVFLASEFTPNAGLVYRNGRVLTVQPHPEFTDDYALALAELRRGRVPHDVVEAAKLSIATPSDSRQLAGYLGAFLKAAA